MNEGEHKLARRGLYKKNTSHLHNYRKVLTLETIVEP